MALPWLAVGKLVLANLDTLVGMAKPLFTSRQAGSVASQAELLNQQIAELQAASSTNAEQIRELAAQLKQLVTALDQAALAATEERDKMRKLSIAAISVSLVSLGAVLVLFLMR